MLQKKQEYVMKRYALWDNLKGLLIMSVVIGHFAEVYVKGNPSFEMVKLFIYAFHMPLFFFISGLHHRNTRVMERILYLVSIGLLWKMVRTVSVFLIYGRIHFALFSEPGVPWFMFAMAAYEGLTWVLRKQNLKWVLILSLFVACFIGFDKNLGDFLCLSRIIIFFPFYLAGVIIDEEKILAIREKAGRVGILGSAAVIVLWATAVVLRFDQLRIMLHLLTGRNPFRDVILTTGSLWRLACDLLTVVLCVSLIFLVPNRNIKGVTKIGVNAINVYFWHYLFLEILLYLFNWENLISQGPAGKMVYLITAAAVTVLLGLPRIFSFPCRQIKNAVFENVRSS